jgi:hypothetical protein
VSHAALRYRSPDAFHPVLAQHDPVARGNRDCVALRGGCARDRLRGGKAYIGRGLRD